MGTRSRMRKDPLYYKRRKQEQLMRKFSSKGHGGKMHEIEVYYRRLEFPHMDKCDWGANRYCILCHKGNGKKILNCTASWCTNYSERFTCELRKEEEEEKETDEP